MRRKDSGELLDLESVLNIDNRDRSNRRDDKSSNRSRSKSKNKGKSKLYSRQAVCGNCQKIGYFKKDCKNPKKEWNNSANNITEDVDDALLLVVHITIDD